MANKRVPLNRVVLWLLLTGWLIFALGPYIWMLLTSFKTSSDLFAMPVRYLPTKWSLDAYRDLIGSTPFLRFMKNSMIVAACTTVLTLLLAVPAGFTLSRHHYRGKPVILSLLISSQFFPTILLVLALFPIMKSTGLIQNLFGLVIVYTAFVTPFTIWLIKGFFDNIPKEVDEAAKIDGCNEIRMIWHVLLPVIVPGIVAAAAYIVIYSWNEFLFAVTFASSAETHTVPVGLKTFIGDYVMRWDLLTGGGVTAAVPILVFFMIIQRRLISGLTSGAVKS
ncbi:MULTISPECIES: carbohydrate ABC transporter permease [Cohnella]|jgi:multiple sugar transport system permease protein|uniref:carbohydrate ABC transporter permease n=1 Tax=Cohnella TaxID=329857 RepID=UPI00037DC9F2|nr:MULTISPECIES: carbohydrate ABC transporter permease [Cohnella]REK66244.1 MAG: carbohydrate ABC transporter permease [Cohnella sp.]